jgi:Putative redox-active protein (C_GCAxxG_C_C)
MRSNMTSDPLLAARALTLRRRSVGNLLRMGHCAPTVMQTMLDVTATQAPWLVRLTAGLPGGIGNTGGECGGVTAPLLVMGLRDRRDQTVDGLPVTVDKGHDHLSVNMLSPRGDRRREAPTLLARTSHSAVYGPGVPYVSVAALGHADFSLPSGGGGIRTHGRGCTPSPVFKTGAFGRSATPPDQSRIAAGAGGLPAPQAGRAGAGYAEAGAPPNAEDAWSITCRPNRSEKPHRNAAER